MQERNGQRHVPASNKNKERGKMEMMCSTAERVVRATRVVDQRCMCVSTDCRVYKMGVFYGLRRDVSHTQRCLVY